MVTIDQSQPLCGQGIQYTRNLSKYETISTTHRARFELITSIDAYKYLLSNCHFRDYGRNESHTLLRAQINEEVTYVTVCNSVKKHDINSNNTTGKC
jgi:hypothetical protein